MKIAKLEFTPINIPYTHREVSSQVNRDGVSDVIVKATTDDGLVGWGEACSGANLASVEEALRAMAPFVLGRSPWSSEAIRADLWHKGIWMFRKPTASFAYAGIDMALWDICGKASNQPLYNLFGGKVRESADYFFYLARGAVESLVVQCRDGVARGYSVFYLKVGLDIEAEYEMVRIVRETIGPERRLRLDANGAWTVNQATRNLDLLDQFHIDFIEQPVMPDPVANMQEVRARGGQLYVFADADTRIGSADGTRVIRMPEHYGALSPILHVVPLQLLAYHTAVARGTDVDKPRNLAKSVTVE